MCLRILPPTLFIVFLLIMLISRWQFSWIDLLPYPWNLGGIFPLTGGLVVSALGSKKFEREGTNIHTFKEPDLLITDHIYRYSRNPMYLGFVVTILGMAILLGNICSFIMGLLFFLVLNNYYVQYEEQSMYQKFGNAYLDYKAKTRRWL